MPVWSVRWEHWDWTHSRCEFVGAFTTRELAERAAAAYASENASHDEADDDTVIEECAIDGTTGDVVWASWYSHWEDYRLTWEFLGVFSSHFEARAEQRDRGMRGEVQQVALDDFHWDTVNRARLHAWQAAQDRKSAERAAALAEHHAAKERDLQDEHELPLRLAIVDRLRALQPAKRPERTVYEGLDECLAQLLHDAEVVANRRSDPHWPDKRGPVRRAMAFSLRQLHGYVENSQAYADLATELFPEDFPLVPPPG